MVGDIFIYTRGFLPLQIFVVDIFPINRRVADSGRFAAVVLGFPAIVDRVVAVKASPGVDDYFGVRVETIHVMARTPQ